MNKPAFNKLITIMTHLYGLNLEFPEYVPDHIMDHMNNINRLIHDELLKEKSELFPLFYQKDNILMDVNGVVYELPDAKGMYKPHPENLRKVMLFETGIKAPLDSFKLELPDFASMTDKEILKIMSYESPTLLSPSNTRLQVKKFCGRSYKFGKMPDIAKLKSILSHYEDLYHGKYSVTYGDFVVQHDHLFVEFRNLVSSFVNLYRNLNPDIDMSYIMMNPERTSKYNDTWYDYCRSRRIAQADGRLPPELDSSCRFIGTAIAIPYLIDFDNWKINFTRYLLKLNQNETYTKIVHTLDDPSRDGTNYLYKSPIKKHCRRFVTQESWLVMNESFHLDPTYGSYGASCFNGFYDYTWKAKIANDTSATKMTPYKHHKVNVIENNINYFKNAIDFIEHFGELKDFYLDLHKESTVMTYMLKKAFGCKLTKAEQLAAKASPEQIEEVRQYLTDKRNILKTTVEKIINEGVA